MQCVKIVYLIEMPEKMNILFLCSIFYLFYLRSERYNHFGTIKRKKNRLRYISNDIIDNYFLFRINLISEIGMENRKDSNII